MEGLYEVQLNINCARDHSCKKSYFVCLLCNTLVPLPYFQEFTQQVIQARNTCITAWFYLHNQSKFQFHLYRHMPIIISRERSSQIRNYRLYQEMFSRNLQYRWVGQCTKIENLSSRPCSAIEGYCLRKHQKQDQASCSAIGCQRKNWRISRARGWTRPSSQSPSAPPPRANGAGLISALDDVMSVPSIPSARRRCLPLPRARCLLPLPAP